jgi:hypothetical protein
MIHFPKVKGETDMTRKFVMLLGLGLVLSSSPAFAADLNPSQIGSACGLSEEGNWHFVNNQTGTIIPGQLTATWSSGETCTTGPSKVTPGGTQHFRCEASGALTGASTNLNGRLVLSDFSCEPSKCVPDTKGEICGDGKDNDCDGIVDEKECTNP